MEKGGYVPVELLDPHSAPIAFQFYESLSHMSSHILPVLGCGVNCWPAQLIVFGHGFQIAEGNQYSCKAVGSSSDAATASVITSSSSYLQNSQQLICIFGTEKSNPDFVRQDFFVEVIRVGHPSPTYSHTANGTVLFRDGIGMIPCDSGRYTTLDGTNGCALRSSGPVFESLLVSGWGFDSSKSYMCAFQSASEFVELGPAYVLNNGEMHCFIPFWNRVESVTNIVIQDMVQNRTLALEMAAGSEIFIFYAVWWLDLDTQIGSVAGTFGPTLSPAIGHDPINSPMVTIHGIGFNPEDTFFVRFQGVGNDQATLTTPALTDEQAYLTSIINDTLLIFSLPSYAGPETVVSMTLFKCRAYPNCEEISKEQGLSVAHPGDAVLTTFRYVATWRSFSMPAVGDAASSYCDPYGSQKCWGVSGGGDMISVHGKGFGTLSAYRYACKF